MSGHGSHKGGGIKQSHDTGQLDSAATMPGEPQEILDEGEGYPFNAQGSQPNPAALERPSDRPPEQSLVPSDQPESIES